MHGLNIRRMIVLVGTGNNGGDGYVIASLGIDAEIVTEVIQVGDHMKLQGDAKKAHDLFVEKGGNCESF